MTMLCALHALLLVVLYLVGTPTEALRVKPTIQSLQFEVGDDEVCLYATGHEVYEGVALRYLVLQGGVDFDMFIRDPRNKTIYASYAGEHGLEDRVYFTTHSTREHSFCINNRGYSKAKKVVKMEVGLTSLKRWKDRIDPLHKLMEKTDGYFLGMHDDQLILRLREQSLRQQLEKTFTLMTMRGVTEAAVIAAMSLINVLLVTHLFRRNTKRVTASRF